MQTRRHRLSGKVPGYVEGGSGCSDHVAVNLVTLITEEALQLNESLIVAIMARNLDNIGKIVFVDDINETNLFTIRKSTNSTKPIKLVSRRVL